MAERATALAVDRMNVRYGPTVALEDASVEVRSSEIVGLLGPNGAGKTTLLDATSGLLPHAEGSVTLLGEDVSSLDAAHRARRGLGRTYQDARLFPGLTVRESVQLGLAKGRHAGFATALLGAPWARFAEREAGAEADELIARFGLGPWAGTFVSHLSTGTRRLCDLVVQLATGSRVLLLDEPAAGIAQSEVDALGPLLRRLRDESGCSMLIVEHDVALLLSVADRVYALQAGRIIAEGSPARVRRDPVVLDSYLGRAARRRRRPSRTRPSATKRPASS